jgi:hypothetical protein
VTFETDLTHPELSGGVVVLARQHRSPTKKSCGAMLSPLSYSHFVPTCNRMMTLDQMVTSLQVKFFCEINVASFVYANILLSYSELQVYTVVHPSSTPCLTTFLRRGYNLLPHLVEYSTLRIQPCSILVQAGCKANEEQIKCLKNAKQEGTEAQPVECKKFLLLMTHQP